MPRKTRIEYEGACYHAISRGNYREWIFEEKGEKEAFEGCPAEAVVRAGWVVMGFRQYASKASVWIFPVKSFGN